MHWVEGSRLGAPVGYAGCTRQWVSGGQDLPIMMQILIRC
jgi:hypothetical protein